MPRSIAEAEKVWAALRSIGLPRAVDVDFRSLEMGGDGEVVRIALDLHYRRGREVCCGEPGCVPYLGVHNGHVAEVVRTALHRSAPVTIEVAATLLHETGFRSSSVGVPADGTIEYCLTEKAAR